MLQQDTRSLEQVIGDLLAHLSPDTRDKALLDQVTLWQLAEASYAENTLPRDAFYANFLVPRDLYQAKLNQVWRYPPSIEFSFRAKKTGDNPRFTITAGFGVPRFLVYKEKRMAGKGIRLMEVTQTKVRAPIDFATVDLFGRSYDMREGNQIERRTVPPIMYKVIESVELARLGRDPAVFTLQAPQQEVVLKKFDERSNRLSSALSQGRIVGALSDDSEDPNDPDPKVATIRLVNARIQATLEVDATPGDGPDEYTITARLVNQSGYTRRPPRENEWRGLCLLAPYITIELHDMEAALGPQQHAEALELALSGSPPKEDSHFQVNCVLTRSTRNKSLLLGTPFGIYDLLRERPVPYDRPIEAMVASPTALLGCLSPEVRALAERSSEIVTHTITVLKALRDAFDVGTLYRYQWEAIQQRIRILLSGHKSTTTVIKAPTGTGKTVVFMANAALHHLATGERAALVFPTRILNEDMFKRLRASSTL